MIDAKSSEVERIPRIDLPKTPVVVREELLESLVKGRKVLHVGCTDSPYTRERHAAGLLLHNRLAPLASRLVGIDLDQDAIAWLSAQGVPDLHVADATRLGGFLESISFAPDLVLAGEVVEHLSNPGNFLSALREGLPSGARLVVTVPSAFAYFGILQMLLGREKVHPDHVAYYSYGTLKTLLEGNGFEVESLTPCRNREARSIDRILHWPFHQFLRLRPHFATGYVAVAKVRKG